MSPAIDLRARYGNVKLRQATNRAIRAELPGGAEALDALELLHKIVRRVGEVEPDGRTLTIAAVAYERLCSVVNAMDAEIRRRYGMPVD